MRCVQITMAEDFGVAGRGRFYEEAGAIRDVVQNHLLQLVSLIAMEPPAGFGPRAQRDAKAALFNVMRPIDPAESVRGQFVGYRDEDGVAKDSNVETFVALTLHIDSWRWAGVPFHIRAGKCLPVKAAEVVVELNQPPIDVFGTKASQQARNYVRFRIGEDQVVIGLGVQTKRSGEEMLGDRTELEVVRNPGTGSEESYERLLTDAMAGDPTLFAREDAVEQAWRVVQPILDDSRPVIPYTPGTWGPAEASAILPDGEVWLDPAADAAGAPDADQARFLA